LSEATKHAWNVKLKRYTSLMTIVHTHITRLLQWEKQALEHHKLWLATWLGSLLIQWNRYLATIESKKLQSCGSYIITFSYHSFELRWQFGLNLFWCMWCLECQLFSQYGSHIVCIDVVSILYMCKSITPCAFCHLNLCDCALCIYCLHLSLSRAVVENHKQGSRYGAYLNIILPISSPNPMFDHLLESSPRDDSNKWSNIGFGEETTQIEYLSSFYALYLELWWTLNQSCTI